MRFLTVILPCLSKHAKNRFCVLCKASCSVSLSKLSSLAAQPPSFYMLLVGIYSNLIATRFIFPGGSRSVSSSQPSEIRSTLEGEKSDREAMVAIQPAADKIVLRTLIIKRRCWTLLVCQRVRKLHQMPLKQKNDNCTIEFY